MKHFFVFLSVFFIFASCKNDVDLFSASPSNKISVEITGDENVIINTENIEIKKGSKWKNIKRKALNCVKYEEGYVFASSFLDEKKLTENYVFNQNATIYITSKLKESNSEHDIELTVIGDEYIEIDDKKLVIAKDTTWQEIKADVNARLKFQLGYKLSKWKIGKSKNARILKDNYVFKKDCTIYAISEKADENMIVLNLIGDQNVELQYTSLEVVFGSSWLEIKDGKYICSAKAKDGYTLSEWKIENDVQGKNVSDNHIFNKDTTLYIFAINNTIDDPHLPDQNGEIDDLGMVEVIPPVEGIKGVKIDYTLCNYLVGQDKKLWSGVFEEGTLTKLSAYKIHQYETTYKLWKEVYDWAVLHGYVFENTGHRGYSETNNEETKEDEPVTEVNYRDCLVWCNAYTEKLNNSTSSCVYLENKDGDVLKNAKEEKDGKNLCDNAYIDLTRKGFRLPSEFEWELAARLQVKNKTNAVLYGNVYLTKVNSASGATLPICTPKLKEPNIDAMNKELESTVVCKNFYNGVSFVPFDPEVTKTSSVGSKRANQLGLYDMSGNVAEWCSPLTQDKTPLDSNENKVVIVRGSSWYHYSYNCAIGYREKRYSTTSAATIGFRLCRSK